MFNALVYSQNPLVSITIQLFMSSMQTQLNKDYEDLPKITEAKSGYLSKLRIFVVVLLVILTLGLLLLLYFKSHKIRNLIRANVFVQSSVPQEITHFLIADTFQFRGDSRSVNFELFIIKPYYRLQGHPLYLSQNQSQNEFHQTNVAYLEHRSQRYYVNLKDQNMTLHSLKFRPNKLFSKYCQQGINNEEISLSKEVYGESTRFGFGYFTGFKKIISHNKFRFTFMILALKRLIFGIISGHSQRSANESLSNSLNTEKLFTTLSIAIELFITFLLMIVFSVRLKKQQNLLHKKLDHEQKYEVIRNGQTNEILIHELLVGDIVRLKKNHVFYMKGILVSDSSQKMFSVVNEKLYNQIDQPIQKQPLENNGSELFAENIINPGSIILNMGEIIETQQLASKKASTMEEGKSAKQTRSREPGFETSIQGASSIQERNGTGELFIIVTDNRYSKKFYQQYEGSSTYESYSSLRHDYNLQHLLFGGSFFVVSLVMVLLAEYSNQSHSTPFIDLVLMPLIMCFPFNMLCFSLISDAISVGRLNGKRVVTVNPVIEDIAMCQELSLSLSAFEDTQFSGFLSKENMFGQNKPDRFQNQVGVFEHFRRTRSDAIFAFFANCGMMNLQVLDQDPISRYLFEHFDFKFREQNDYDDQSEVQRVVNANEETFKVDWSEFKRFEINEKLIETVLIRDHHNDKIILISQGYFTDENCEDHFRSVCMEHRSEYISNMKKNLLRGKKIKYLCLKRNFIDNEVLKNPDLEVKRQDVQKKLSYAGNIVFDEWAPEDNFRAMRMLSDSSSGSGFHVSFLSMKSEEQLYGYDHLLQDETLLYGQDSTQRADLVRRYKRTSTGVVHFGDGTLDQAATLASDVSLNLVSDSPCQADFYLTQPDQMLAILSEGRWKLDTITLSIICLTMINFSKILGETVLTVNYKLSREALFDDLLLEIAITVVPVLLLNLYRSTKINPHSERHFFRIDWCLSVFLSLVSLATLYFILFMGHIFSCEGENTNIKNLPPASSLQHAWHSSLQLRHFDALQPSNDNQWTHLIKIFEMQSSQKDVGQNLCETSVYFINVTFALLVILIMDHETPSREAPLWLRHLNKLYMLLVWIGTILHYKIQPLKVIKASVVLLFIALFAWVVRSLTKSKRKKKDQQEAQVENNQMGVEEDPEASGNLESFK